MGGVFISYRRDDSAGHAGRLYDRLVDEIGDDTVFMDIGTLEPGVDFGERIEQAVESCSLLVVLIGDEWLDITDAHGTRRLDDPADLVRLEVAAALRRDDVRVIPVLVEGARMPPSDRLPDDIKALARRQAFELSDVNWRYDVGRLIEIVERVCGSAPAQDDGPRGAAGRGRRLLGSVRGSRRGTRLVAALAALVLVLALGVVVLGGADEDGGAGDAGTAPAASDLASPPKKQIALQLAASEYARTTDWRSTYDAIRFLEDDPDCDYLAGNVGFCSGTGDMLKLVRAYAKAQPDNPLARFVPALERARKGGPPKAGLGASFLAAWRSAAQDPAFLRAQDAVRDELYFTPAVQLAKSDGLGALGQYAYYSAALFHGEDGMKAIRSRALKQARAPAGGDSQTRYLHAFLDARAQIERASGARSLSAVEDEQRRFLREGNLDLKPPLRWSLDGEDFSI